VIFFQAVITSARAGVINNLVEAIVSHEPIEDDLYIFPVARFREDLMEITQGPYRVRDVYGLLPAYETDGSLLVAHQPSPVGYFQ